MTGDFRDQYLDLLKKCLTDYLRTDSVYANAMPLQWTRPKSPLNGFRNRLLTALLARSHLLAAKSDRLGVDERRRRRQGGTDWPPHAETMLGLRRLDNLQWAIETVLGDGIPGDLIETGVWRGGATIFMRAVLGAHGAGDRVVWACDSFAGLPPPDAARHPADSGDRHHTIGFLAVSLDEVKRNFEKYGLLDDNVRFVKGYFEDTLSGLPVERLALLRLDGDMYGSTITALQALYGKLSPGGFVIVDDYALGPCRAAIEDFRKAGNIAGDIVDIDGTGAYWRKS